MNELHSMTMSTFCDGEPVDPDVLASALADPEGRELLVEFVRLREAVRAPEPLPGSLQELREPRAWWRARVPLHVAATLAAAAALAALLAPRPWDGGSAPAPPTPTQVLRFEPGVDWHQTQ